jgi:PAS domain S-box-containing protein
MRKGKTNDPHNTDTLLQLFDNVRQDPDTIPIEPVDGWQEGSVEWSLLSSFHGMLEQVQQRMHQFRQMEQQLREKEEQYRSIFEAVTDSLTISSLEDGQVVEANPATCKMLGYSYEELIGKLPSDLVPSDNLSLVTEGLQTLRAGGRNDLAMMTLRKDGTTFPTEVHSTLFNFKGKTHLLTVSRDITERVQAEELLREKEEQYRSIFEATDDGLSITDLDGFYIEVNPAYCRMLGYTREELIDIHYSQTTFPEYYHVLEESAQAIEVGDQYQTQGLARRKDGSPLPVEAHATPFIYKGKPHILGVMHDITERVEAEQQLREREEQYRSVFEATSDGLIIRDMDGYVVEANPAACNMHGYTYEEFIGLHRTDIIDPADHAMVAEYMKAIQAGRSFMGQAVDLRKDGTAFPVEVRGSTFTYLGKPHTLSVLRDITERVEAERQLREKEEQYRSIFEASSDGLFIVDLDDSHSVEVNPMACKMFGYTHEEMLGRTVRISDDTQQIPLHAHEIIRAGGQFQMRDTTSRKDGTLFNAEVRATPFIYKGKPHLLAIVRDITVQMQAEQQLREKEEQYRSIFEASADGIHIIDLENSQVVEVNPAASKMYGYTREEMLDHSTSLVEYDETQHILINAFEVIKAGGRFQTRDIGRRKDGTVFDIDVRATPFTYKGLPHMLVIDRDITEQVQAEQLLEHRVEERTRELSSLLEISHTVASTLQLDPLLGLILDQLKTVVDYTGSAILVVEGESLIILDNRSPIQEVQLMQLRFPLKELGPIWETMISRESIIMPDVRDDTYLAQAFRAALGKLGETTFSYVRACMVVPLSLKEQVIGMLVLTSSKEEAFTPHHATLALAIANQAAVAIENARLYEQAQELAAIEERQRLARELHDSVSQALYGISLGVHTARMQLDRDPKELAESLDYVLELAEAALIEMRALIFELRPESLETEGLVNALTKQAAALHARQGILVQLNLCQEPGIPLKVKQDLYRIAQEALHNMVKHARASLVELNLDQTNEMIMLEIQDNGRGFDTTSSYPGHLGLHSMQERVKSLGGELLIESFPGQGTRIRAQVPVHTTANNTAAR